uniref:NADH-ubiquinone oxidoreductase chain 5 n=1 Tax=Oryzaephilus surinamensis TaxID=41112 RepID=A0A8A6NND6_ORYSU|nr:NADH dehydrogenase subunit 5 [Oryzaephilus surinamensis]
MFLVSFYYFVVLFMFSMILFSTGIYFLDIDYSLFIDFSLIEVNSSLFSFIVYLDWMSLIFMSFVLFISSVVILYSSEYLGSDKTLNRFIYLVVMFVASMMFLILSPNIFSMLLGWDGLGLVSYCLVIYYQNLKSYNAGMLTALSNRLGDVALLFSISWMMLMGSWNYMFYLSEIKMNYLFIYLMIIVASFTKSAQIPFSSWLPAAMAAPTPVSSLVHSSTLVTAGVYLLIRFYEGLGEDCKMFFFVVSCLTMFMSGMGANFEYDLKKIIALSTLSQLGLMMSVLFLGGVNLAFFHLLVHALFKALLFMCAGNIIHIMGGFQDIRFMGGLINKIPLTCALFNISNLSLCGFPFMSGFYSKDLILEFSSFNGLNLFMMVMFYVSVGLTVSYSFRLVYYLMVGDYNFNGLMLSGDFLGNMIQGMLILGVTVVFSGSLLMWLIFSYPVFLCMSFDLKILSLLMVFTGVIMGVELTYFNYLYLNKSIQLYSLVYFLSSMWNLPFLSTWGLNFLTLDFSELMKKNDRSWIEYYGPMGLGDFLIFISSKLQSVFKIHLKTYFLFLVFWVFIVYMVF